MVDTATLNKWLEDVNEVDRYLMQSFVNNYATPEQTSAYNAARNTLAELRQDFKLKLNG